MRKDSFSLKKVILCLFPTSVSLRSLHITLKIYV